MSYVWMGGPTRQRDGIVGDVMWPSTDEGVTVVRDAAGVWSQVQNAPESELAGYVYVLRGGRVQTVDAVHYAELVAAGYGSFFRVNDEYSVTYIRTMEN